MYEPTPMSTSFSAGDVVLLMHWHNRCQHVVIVRTCHSSPSLHIVGSDIVHPSIMWYSHSPCTVDPTLMLSPTPWKRLHLSTSSINSRVDGGVMFSAPGGDWVYIGVLSMARMQNSGSRVTRSLMPSVLVVGARRMHLDAIHHHHPPHPHP